jgi:hypothetical protein
MGKLLLEPANIEKHDRQVDVRHPGKFSNQALQLYFGTSPEIGNGNMTDTDVILAQRF